MLCKVVDVCKKNSLYDEQKCVWDIYGADDLVMCLVEFNGHLFCHIDGFNRVHGGYA